MQKVTVLRDLRRSLELVHPFFDAAPDVLRRSYAPGKWTMAEILGHLADCEVVFQERTRRLLSEPGCVVVPFDETRWAKTLLYPRRSLATARRMFASCRESLIELVDLLPEAIFARDGRVHGSDASVRAWDVATKASTHTMHHFGQLEAIRDGREWVP